MRLPQRMFFIIVAAGVIGISIAEARSVFITSATKTDEKIITSGSATRTIVTFKFGDLEIKFPRPPNWVDNPMLLRPQLLLLSCPPLSAPSRVHIELLAGDKRARGQGYEFSLLNPDTVAQQYANNPAVVPTTPLGMPGMKCTSFKKVAPAGASGPQLREEIHILNVADVGFRLYMKIEPRINPKDEASLRHSLSNLTVRGFNVETRSNVPDLPDLPDTSETDQVTTPKAEPDSFDIFSSNLITTAKASSTTATPASLAPDICLTDRTLVRQSRRVGDSGTTTALKFNYGELEILMPDVTGWTVSAQVPRPRLLYLYCASPGCNSLVRFDLVGEKVEGKGEGSSFRLVPFDNVVEHYATNSKWTVSSRPPPVPGMTNAAFQKGGSSAGEPLEVIHFLNTNNMTFCLREVLSPELKPSDAAALYGALSNLVIRIPPPKNPVVDAKSSQGSR